MYITDNVLSSRTLNSERWAAAECDATL